MFASNNPRERTRARRMLHSQEGTRAALDLASAACTASIAASLAGMVLLRKICSSAGSAPLSSAATRVAQPASVIWVWSRSSLLTFASTLIGDL